MRGDALVGRKVMCALLMQAGLRVVGSTVWVPCSESVARHAERRRILDEFCMPALAYVVDDSRHGFLTEQIVVCHRPVQNPDRWVSETCTGTFSQVEIRYVWFGDRATMLICEASAGNQTFRVWIESQEAVKRGEACQIDR